ncbi:TldE protein, part of TldE/TldD proteolytic complex [hydrothermal vent metagenome]|uniref:TldE protein, part of TldE/TldD proteolytic complex n=1 Tax=hydrothermal vent metagenome TaxID=652676 RepID=A0A3B1AHA0_9ZZZZ
MPSSLAKSVFSENKLPDNEHLKQIVDLILHQAKLNGATQAEAGANVESGLCATVRLGEVETIEHNRDKGLGVTVYFDKRKGSASTTDYSEQAIIDTVKAACDIARYTSEDEFTGLADESLMARNIPDLDLYHPWDISAEQAIEIATDCEMLARNFDSRITNSEGATVNSHIGLRFYGNSHGFMGSYPSSRHSITCALIAESDNAMQRDYWYSVAREAKQLESNSSIAQKTAERTLAKLGSRKINTTQTPVIYSSEVAGGLIGHFLRAINGSLLYRDATFLLNSLNTTVFPEFLSISESPHLIKGLGSAAFDSEGVATRNNQWVLDGVVQNYILSSYSARKLAMATTANAGGVRNIRIKNKLEEVNLTQLLQTMGTGLYITELMGQGINMVNGDYSRGASGFWVENGEIQYPVEEITVAGNLRDMFLNIVNIANDVDVRGNIQCGSILIEQMQIAGN